MAKSRHKHHSCKHDRNESLVQRYVQSIKNAKKDLPHESPVDIYTDLNITRQRFFKILKDYGIKPYYFNEVLKVKS